jgi:polyphosphate kinase
MYRNLNNRVELVAPVDDPPARQRLWQVLETLLADRRQAWKMQPDGAYVQRQPGDEEVDIGTHAQLMRLARPPAATGGNENGNGAPSAR